MDELTNADGPLPPSTPGPVDDTTVWSTTPGQLRAFLGAHLGAEIEPLVPVGQGAWSRCFAFSHTGRDLVVKLGAYPEDFRRDRWAARALSASGLPVPEIIEIGEAFGCWFVIATRVTGRPLEDADAVAWRRLLPSVLAMLDAVHAVDLDGRPGHGHWTEGDGGTSGSWHEHLLSVGADTPTCRTPGWSRNLATVPEAETVFERGLAALDELAADIEPPRTLVHADTLHGNVLVDDHQLTGLLDWGSSLYGDPLYDYAWFLFWAPWHPGLAALDDVETFRDHLGAVDADLADFDQRLQVCLLHIGLDHITYSAHTERWRDLARLAAAVDALLAD